MHDLQVSVNLSARQLNSKNIVDTVQNAINNSGLKPECLTLELTESMVMDRATETINTLKQLKSIGVKLAIDDFGTGYSSLGYLKRLPVDKLKIDRIFIADIGVDPNDEAITSAIIAMSKSLNLTVIAEGTQTKRQMEFLRQQQCDEVQGFYFSKPIDVESCTRLLLENHGILGDCFKDF